MANVTQIQANSANAQLSTGPRSVEGKAVTRFNALKHGMDAASILIPGEDPTEFERLSAGFHLEFQPEGLLEISLVDSIVRSEWFRRRYAVVEAQLWRTLLKNSEDPNATAGDVFFADAAGKNTLGKLHRRQQAVLREFDRSVAEIRKLQKDRMPEGPLQATISPGATAAPSKPSPEPPPSQPAVAEPPSRDPNRPHPKPIPGQPWVGSEPPSWRL